MTKGQFMKELEIQLACISENERKDALEYYNDYFADGNIEDNMEVPESLGTPKQVASTIIKENEQKVESNLGNQPTISSKKVNPNASANNRMAVIIIIALITSPVWGGFAVGILGMFVGVIAGLFGMIVAFLIGGAAIVIASFMLAASSVSAFLLVMGLGIMMIGLGLLSTILLVLLCGRFIPWLVKVIIDLVNKLLGRKEQEHEKSM